MTNLCCNLSIESAQWSPEWFRFALSFFPWRTTAPREPNALYLQITGERLQITGISLVTPSSVQIVLNARLYNQVSLWVSHTKKHVASLDLIIVQE